MLGGGPDEHPDRYAAADPARRPGRAVIVHGVDDEVVPIEIARAYAAAARPSGIVVDLVELPAENHFGVIDPQSTAWPAVLAALSRS